MPIINIFNTLPLFSANAPEAYTCLKKKMCAVVENPFISFGKVNDAQLKLRSNRNIFFLVQHANNCTLLCNCIPFRYTNPHGAAMLKSSVLLEPSQWG